jgi:ABC-2 type transport system ATP-binding protein
VLKPTAAGVRRPDEVCMIVLDKLCRNYGKNVAVSEVTAEIRKGEIVGLLGHNGAGKTTVMKILTGYLDATSGRVTIDGLDVATQRDAVQARIGYLPEQAPLYDDMLVQDYLLMMAELRGVPAEKRADAVRRAASATSIQSRMLDPIGTLSKGLRQRVGIAQAIVHDPAVLVFDEPTNGLDPVQIQSIRTLLKELGKTSTVILSTHILQEVEAVCDRVLVMIGGRLVADAPLAEFTTSRTVRLVLGGAPDDVSRALAAVEGVVEVAAPTPTPDGTAYRVRFAGDRAPVPGILAVASKAGWEVRAIAPEVRTLDMAFQELQNQQLRAAEAGVA